MIRGTVTRMQPSSCNGFLTRCRLMPMVCLLAISVSLCGGHDCPADDSHGDDSSTSSARSVPEVIVGIEGHYRVGCWTAVRIVGSASGIDNASLIETRDGDGVRVAYQQAQPLANGSWGYVIPGSEAVPLIVRGESEVLLTTRFPTLGSPSSGPSMIPLKMPWIVAIGDPLGVDQVGANEILNRDALIAVSIPKNADGFPDSVLGYDGVDMIMIGGSSRKILAALGDSQRSAIRQWILGGGRAFLTLGESAPELLQAAPWLGELLPLGGEELSTTKLDPSALETFTSSQTPLAVFSGIRLPKQQGRSLITGRTTRRVSTPMAVEYNVGLGRIAVVTADLEQPMFAQWPERLDLITRLTGSILIPRQQDTATKSRATAYDDLAGQMRVTLDQFAVKRTFSFSVLSLILMGLIAAIGPLDYLLINRVCGRPLLGWLSFPLMAIGLSVVLVQQAGLVVANSETGDDHTLASEVRCNRLEFVDIDSTAGFGRGSALSYLYTHPATLLDVDSKNTSALDSISDRVERMLTTPFGYPGESFGGIQIAIEDARLPMYQVTIRETADEVRRSLKGLPLAPRSSKSIATRFWFKPKLSSSVTMARRPGSQLLQGELTNPLPIDLLDGMLIYRNWVYLLPTRFPAGDRITAVEDLRQKNFRWQLSRQKALEEARTEGEDWDPAMNDSPQRIAEMLMFHRAVGGTRYTSLQDDPLSFLDLSHVLAEDRCILVGRLASPLSQLAIRTTDQADHIPAGDTMTMIRLVLPVESKASR